MRKILLISPHFDDAVLSAGQLMADRPDCEVVTVFAGTPQGADAIQTPYDLKCGFDNARNAVGARVRENDEALALLEATVINLNFPDSQYGQHASFTDIVERLQEIIDNEDYEMILAPIGIGHPDHIKVTKAVQNLKTDLEIWLWEDLPLRVVDPLAVTERMKDFGHPLQLVTHSTTDTKIAKKIRAMLCYKSQYNTGILDPYLMYVPERFWKYNEGI